MKINLIKKKTIKEIIILTVLFSTYILINAFSYVSEISTDLKESVFRLHVIANSNSEKDQNLKYIVRDNIIQYMKSICNDCNSKEETIKIVSNHLDDFTQIANQTIKDNGFSYTAKVSIGNFKFPTKTYADISFPAGYYDALKIQLGNANGQNWWCVLYPSLCFIDTTSVTISDESREQLKENLNEEEYKIISNSDTNSINIKFKLIELFTQNNLVTAKQDK